VKPTFPCTYQILLNRTEKGTVQSKVKEFQPCPGKQKKTKKQKEKSLPLKRYSEITIPPKTRKKKKKRFTSSAVIIALMCWKTKPR
jgi:hypothetical protein